jgi:hypothetical protein
MKFISSTFAIDFTTFQIVWFACVLSPQTPYPMVLPAAAAIGATCRIISAASLRSNLINGLACLVMGLVGDGLLVHFGLVIFAEPFEPFGIPLWMLCLWFSFGLFLNRLFGWFLKSYHKAFIGFSTGGAIAYLGGSKLGSLSMEHSLATGAIAIEWAAAGLVLCWINRTHRLQNRLKEDADE